MPIRLERSHYTSILLGVVYGIALRLLMERDIALSSGLVSFSFFVIVPIVIGFVSVFFGSRSRAASLKHALFVPWIAILCFLVTTVVLLLEGSVCVALALPGFLILSSGGGLLAYWVERWRLPKAGTLCCVLSLPIAVSPIEVSIPVKSRIETVETQLTISATPDIVWAQITHVGVIGRKELSFGLTRLLGVPQPLEAHMELTTAGWVRISRWEQGIEFREIITDSTEDESLQWTFDFPPSAVPEGVLDEHVRIGGRYFGLIDGGYTLEPDGHGATRLTIRTSYRVTARPALYARYWARLIMSDFHRVLLNLIQDRSERSAG
jgi:hypothetical protein